MSDPAGRPTAALGGADLFRGAASPGPAATVSPQGPHGRTRRFRLGATFVPDPQPELPEGTLLGAQERYRVVRLLGQGGMGRVYEARRERDGLPAAVKVLRSDRVAGNLEELVARFRQEAAATSRVGHRGIVEVLGFERTPDGSVLLAMELLRGETLEDWMSAEGTLAEGLAMVADFCDALHAAHEAGIVHRDIKPENLFLHRDEDGALQPKILDFGLAKVDVPDHTQIETAAGTVLGTPYYLAPERALGKPLTRSADLYSLGVVLYEMLTSVVPFDAPAFMAILEGHVRRVPLDPRQAAPQRPLPDEVCALVMALLSKDPAERPRSAAVVAQGLRGLLRTHAEALSACPTGPRATSEPDADTMSMLALAQADDAPPSRASAEAATVPPVSGGQPASSMAVAQPTAPRRRSAAVFVAVGALVGGAAALAVILGRPDAKPAEAPVAAPAAAGPARRDLKPQPQDPAEPAPPAAQDAPARPVESVVAVPKTPPRPEPSASPSRGGTNATTKKRRPKPREKPRTPEADDAAPPMPAFKDDVYED